MNSFFLLSNVNKIKKATVTMYCSLLLVNALKYYYGTLL